MINPQRGMCHASLAAWARTVGGWRGEAKADMRERDVRGRRDKRAQKRDVFREIHVCDEHFKKIYFYKILFIFTSRSKLIFTCCLLNLKI